PSLDDHLRLGARAEPFEAQALVAELAVEALRDAIVPGLAGLDQRGSDTLSDNPRQECLRHELRTIVAAQESRCAAFADQARQHFDDARRADATVHLDRQPLLGELVGYGQALELLTIGATVKHKVVGPHLVRRRWRLRPRAGRSHALARPFARHLQARRLPEPIRPPHAHAMPVATEKDAN